MSVPRETMTPVVRPSFQAVMDAKSSGLDPKIRREEGLPLIVGKLAMLDGAEVWDYHLRTGAPFEQVFAQLALSHLEPCWSEFFMAVRRSKGGEALQTMSMRVCNCAARAYADHPGVLTRIQKTAERIAGGLWASR